MAYTTQKKVFKRSSTELQNEVGLSLLTPNKRRRISSSKTENESSADSISYSSYIPSDSDVSNDSEFKEHPYSRPTSHCSEYNDTDNRLHNSRPRRKPISDYSHMEAGVNSNKRCKSKNAIMARLNRMKKKQYYEDLENKNAKLEADRKVLKTMLKAKGKEVESLKKKALHLEHVIRNSTEIGSLLKCVHQHTGLKVTSSLLKGEPSNKDHNTEVNVHTQNSSSNGIHELEGSPTEEEAWFGAVIWGVALHTFCQSYKPRTTDILNLQVPN